MNLLFFVGMFTVSKSRDIHNVLTCHCNWMPLQLESNNCKQSNHEMKCYKKPESKKEYSQRGCPIVCRCRDVYLQKAELEASFCQFQLPFGWNKSKSAKVLADCFGDVSQNIRGQTASACQEVLQNQQVLLSFLSCLYVHVPCTWMYYDSFKNMPKLQENDIRNICMGCASLATSLSWPLDASLGFQLYLLLDRSKLRSDAVKKLRRLQNGECSGLNFPMFSQPNRKRTTQKSQPSVSCTTVRKDCKVMLPASENCIPPKVLWGLL